MFLSILLTILALQSPDQSLQPFRPQPHSPPVFYGKNKKEGIPEINYRDFSLLNELFFEYGNFIIQQYDFNDIYYLFDSKVFRMSPLSLNVRDEPIAIPEGAKLDYRYQLKFRFGAWYCRTNSNLFRYAKEENKWKLILQVERQFSQFEITPDENILLIFSALPQTTRGLFDDQWPLDDLSTCVDGTLKFIEIYSEFGEKPNKIIDLPSDFKIIESSVSGLEGPDRSFWVDDKLILCSPRLGLIWCFTSGDMKVHEILTPWTALNTEFLNKHKNKLQHLTKKYEHIGIPQFHFPKSIEFFPYSSNSVFILERGFRIPTDKNQSIINERKSDRYLKYFIELIPNEEEPFGFYDFDLTNYSIKHISLSWMEIKKIQEQKGPFWLNFDASAIPVPVYHAPASVNSLRNTEPKSPLGVSKIKDQ